MNTKKLKIMCFEEFMYFIEKSSSLKNDISIQFYLYMDRNEFRNIKNILIKKIISTQERCQHTTFIEYSKSSFNPLKKFKKRIKECSDCGKIL